MKVLGVAQQMNILPTESLVRSRVRNPQGEDLGVIEDIMVDASSGRIAYAILSFGGFLGLRDKLFAIPWEALELTTETSRLLPHTFFILNVEKERLKTAPGFDRKHYPNMADRRWAAEIQNYYA